MKNSRNSAHISERLKDRHAYRNALIERRNSIDVKISKTEAEIKELRTAKGASA